jgi:hypothetical protein
MQPIVLSQLVLPVLLAGFALGHPQAEPEQIRAPRIQAPVTSVALFKNGLALVRRTAALPGSGRFEIDAVPEFVHGTLWLQSPTLLELHTSEREFEVPTDGRWDLDPTRELAGRSVRIRLRGEPLTELVGRVASFGSPEDQRAWSRSYEQQPHWNHWGSGLSTGQPGYTSPGPARFLALDTDQGRTFVDISMIAFLNVTEPPQVSRVTRPVLELVAPAGSAPLSASISYLAKGLSYAPNYRLDIGDPKSLSISQSAVVRNELEDLVGVEFELISGFPSMEYSHVLSPLSPATTWASFFAQLSQDPNAAGSGSVISQNVASNFGNYSAAGGGAPIQPASEGVDLYYQRIGKRDLHEGEALHIEVASATTAYTRIVDWLIRDTRDEWGNPNQRRGWESSGDREEEGAWDALRFANPFAFPMTTAPATIMSGSRFQGQRTTSWVNPGEETTVRITKALAIRSIHAEFEVENAAGREVVFLGGRTFRSVAVQGELQLCNHRKEAVQMVIRREFSGELNQADGEPQTKLLERGVYSVNRRQELVWNLTLAPGEEKTLEYTYEVLVHH